MRLPKYGSSPQIYAELRPPTGTRYISIPGPSQIWNPRALASCPTPIPFAQARLGFQVAANKSAAGYSLLGTSLRTPFGPSVVRISGRPRLGMAAMLAPVEFGRPGPDAGVTPWI